MGVSGYRQQASPTLATNFRLKEKTENLLVAGGIDSIVASNSPVVLYLLTIF